MTSPSAACTVAGWKPRPISSVLISVSTSTPAMRAEIAAAAADQRRAADDHGGDGLEQIGLADIAIGRAGEAEQQDAGQRRRRQALSA